MEFVSKYNLTFIKYINKKYEKKFRMFEDYSLWLFEMVNSEHIKYFNKLEDDIKEYCEYQQERKNNNGKPKN